jgi:hypothetical protein
MNDDKLFETQSYHTMAHGRAKLRFATKIKT